jgi:integrase
MSKLTDTKIKQAKPGAKPLQMFDGGGLYIEVTPAGAKYWRHVYSFEGRQRRMSLGVYPEVSLKLAREKHADSRKLIAQGIDPSSKRKADREARADTYEAITREWFAKNMADKVDSYSSKVIARQERYVFPWIGSRPIANITRQDITECMDRLDKAQKAETARRALQVCSAVFRYAMNTGRATHNPASDRKGTLTTPVKKPFAAIVEPKRLAEVLRMIDGYRGSFEVASALKLMPLVMLRPGELRGGLWSEIDLDKAEWRIPGERMKNDLPHLVPLSRQAVAILRDVYACTGRGEHVFPSTTKGKPISENTLNKALQSLGVPSSEATPHGFRKTASTTLNEHGFNWDWIERQLSHVPE